MKISPKIFLAAIILILMAVGGFYIYEKYFISTNNQASIITDIISPSPMIQTEFVEPVAEFRQRITKKPFGIYVTPQNSPVSPERFVGYHTAVDIEYQDVSIDVPVYAVADSTVELARTASGYGGVMVLSFNYQDKKTYAVYGHLRLDSMTKKTEVKKGEQIAVLGTGYSTETDNERRHLHFGILKKDTIDLKGYVQSTNELNNGWNNPIDIIK